MDIRIKKTNNGYLVENYNHSCEEEEEIQYDVFEDCGDDQDHVIRMLYSIIEEFDEKKTKHEKRIHIGYEEVDGDLIDTDGNRYLWDDKE